MQISIRLEKSGASPLVTVIAISGAMLAGVQGVSYYQENYRSASATMDTRLSLNTANEEAIELASQLLGNSVVSVKSNKDLQLGTGISSSIDAKNNGIWKVTGGKLEIKGCLNPIITANEASKIYTDNSSSGVSECDSDHEITTTLKVKEVILGDKVTESGARDKFAVIDAASKWNKKPKIKLNRSARLRFGDATKICDIYDSTASCGVDHCKYV